MSYFLQPFKIFRFIWSNYFQQTYYYGPLLIIKDLYAFLKTKRSIFNIKNEERVSRFITRRSCYNRNDRDKKGYLELNHKGFLPNPYVELSVFRTSEIAEKLVWKLGWAVSGMLDTTHTLRGRGDIIVREIIKSENSILSVKPAPLPFSHSNITGYPSNEDSKLQEAAQYYIALELSLKAGKLIRVPA